MRPRGLERLGRRAGDRAAEPAQVGRLAAREGLERVEAEDVRPAARGRAQRGERGGAARVPDQAGAAGDGLGGGRDLRVGDAEQDHVARGDLAAPGGPVDLVSGLPQRCRQRHAEAALSDYSEFHGGEVRSPAAE